MQHCCTQHLGHEAAAGTSRLLHAVKSRPAAAATCHVLHAVLCAMPAGTVGSSWLSPATTTSTPWCACSETVLHKSVMTLLLLLLLLVGSGVTMVVACLIPDADSGSGGGLQLWQIDYCCCNTRTELPDWYTSAPCAHHHLCPVSTTTLGCNEKLDTTTRQPCSSQQGRSHVHRHCL